MGHPFDRWGHPKWALVPSWQSGSVIPFPADGLLGQFLKSFRANPGLSHLFALTLGRWGLVQLTNARGHDDPGRRQIGSG